MEVSLLKGPIHLLAKSPEPLSNGTLDGRSQTISNVTALLWNVQKATVWKIHPIVIM